MRVEETDSRVTVMLDELKRVEALKKPDFSVPPVPREMLAITTRWGTRLELVLPPGGLKELQRALSQGGKHE